MIEKDKGPNNNGHTDMEKHLDCLPPPTLFLTPISHALYYIYYMRLQMKTDIRAAKSVHGGG